MSSSSDSSSSSSGSEAEESFYDEIVEFSGIVPYDEDLEPFPTPEEAVELEARMTEEADNTKLVQEKFLRHYFLRNFWSK